MKKNLTHNEALARLQAQCSLGEKCISEAMTKLTQWGIDADQAEAIVKQLQEDKFIDERRYTRAFVSDKTRFAKWGIVKIKMALKAKKIPTALIEEALQELDPDENKDTLTDLLQKKARTTKANNPRDMFAKLMRFGLSRGFEYDQVFHAVSAICKD